MALSDLWNLGQLRAAVRRELNDTRGNLSWSWSDAELQEYIGAAQDLLQDHFEFTWGTATLTNVSTATITFTNVATDMLRFDSLWWNSLRLTGKDKAELEVTLRDWRSVKSGTPQTMYQDDSYSVSVFPPPDPTIALGTQVIFEYPRRLTFMDDTTKMGTPAWTKYGLVSYACWRAMLRPGPNQDLTKAAGYEQKFRYQLKRFRTIQDAHLPARAPSLRPGGKFEGDILNVGLHNSAFSTWF
jgi:hypothetical protein